SDLRRVNALLNGCPAPRTLLVQWVPHGYGWRSLNVAFAMWLAGRALAGDSIELLVHEPYLEVSMHPARLAAALVHRAMLIVAAASAHRIFVSTPSWIPAVRPYALWRQSIEWLPVPAPLLPVRDPTGVAETRRALAPGRRPLVGHFSSFSPLITDLLQPAAERLLRDTGAHILLLGHGS